MSKNMILNGPAPSDLAASTYSFSLIDSVWPRTILAMPAQEKNVIITTMIVRLGPKTTASASASTMYGKASTASVNRASTVSMIPPKYPAMSPTVTPSTEAISVVTMPTNSEMRTP